MEHYTQVKSAQKGDLVWIEIVCEGNNVWICAEVLDTNINERRTEIRLMCSDNTCFWVNTNLLLVHRFE